MGEDWQAFQVWARLPWVLCECGFISNAGDADIMKHHPESIANVIAEGVHAYTSNQ